MKYNFQTIFVLFIIILSFSCDKYLDIPPTDELVPTTVTDYESLLNHGLVLNSRTNILASFGDSFQQTLENVYFQIRDQNAAVWADQIYSDRDDDLYEESYNAILNWNTIIENILNADGNPQRGLQVQGEAYLSRALEYLTLVNAYAKPYNPSTASTDLAIPIRLGVNIVTNGQRATVEEIYNLILSDLENARLIIGENPLFPNNPYRGSLAATHGMLARTYMLMGNFPLVLEHANTAINLASPMSFNFNRIHGLSQIEFSNFFQDVVRFPDEVYKRNSGRLGGIHTEVYVTKEYMDLFEDNDIRKISFISENPPQNSSDRPESGFFFYNNNYRLSIGVMKEDLHLMRAEAALRVNNDMKTALADLNLLRSLRYLTGTYTPLTTSDFTTPKELLQFVIDERRRELGLTIYRWYDLRRLADESGAKTVITRQIGANTYSINLLTDNNIVMPIPNEVIQFNPEMEQNPRDGRMFSN